MDEPQHALLRSSFDRTELLRQPMPTSEHYRNSPRSHPLHPTAPPAASSLTMSIQNMRTESHDPASIYPPQYAETTNLNPGGERNEVAWRWSNSDEGSPWGKGHERVSSGMLEDASTPATAEPVDLRPDLDRRGSSSSTVRSLATMEAKRDQHPTIDEGYASLSTVYGSHRSSRDDLRSGFTSSMHERFRSNSSSYDSSVLKKLDSHRQSENSHPNTPPEISLPVFSSSLNDSEESASRRFGDRKQLQPLSLPSIINHPDFADRYTEEGVFSTSPRDRYAPGAASSPRSRGKEERSILPFRTSILKADDSGNPHSRSSRGSYDVSLSDVEPSFAMDETSRMRQLNIEDRTSSQGSLGSFAEHAAGQKRRASSPPREELHGLRTVNSSSDLQRRRESASRSSSNSTSRMHSTHGSISSVTSGLRANSYTSIPFATGNISNNSPYTRIANGDPGSGTMAPVGGFLGMPNMNNGSGWLMSNTTPSSGLSPTGGSLTPEDYEDSTLISPRGSVLRPAHRRQISLDQKAATASRKSSTDIIGHSMGQGGYMCECCPKKPKRFETAGELTAHEQEKQYECAYCKNRFKNKNEAERHQNSLHLRRHSWSCAALAGYASAFHLSSSRPKEADCCGYCGDEFERTGPLDGHGMRQATEHDWAHRVTHLGQMHKFGECNQGKKFFRADHFRQHLKHSHAGTSGKWTNMLENACMKDEPLPVPRIREEVEDM